MKLKAKYKYSTEWSLGYIGNAKVLNASTRDDLLSETHMSTYEYTYVYPVNTDFDNS